MLQTCAALDYTEADLAEFDRLIVEYAELVFPNPEEGNLKRVELLAARRQMAPARVKVELAEFRTLIDEMKKARDETARQV